MTRDVHGNVARARSPRYLATIWGANILEVQVGAVVHRVLDRHKEVERFAFRAISAVAVLAARQCGRVRGELQTDRIGPIARG